MDGWVFMRHADTAGTTRVPDNPGVVEWHEAHGWERADEPEDVPFAAPKPGGSESPWVELVHPAIDARHDFPNDPGAIAGAIEAGWRYPEPAVKKTSTKASSKPATDKDEE